MYISNIIYIYILTKYIYIFIVSLKMHKMYKLLLLLHKWFIAGMISLRWQRNARQNLNSYSLCMCSGFYWPNYCHLELGPLFQFLNKKSSKTENIIPLPQLFKIKNQKIESRTTFVWYSVPICMFVIISVSSWLLEFCEKKSIHDPARYIYVLPWCLCQFIFFLSLYHYNDVTWTLYSLKSPTISLFV